MKKEVKSVLLSSTILTLISSVMAYAYVGLDYSLAEMDDDDFLLPRLPEGLSDIEPQKISGTSEQIESSAEGEPSDATFPEGFDSYELYAEFQAYVLVAGDEEWQDVNYWTPFGWPNTKDWKHAAYEIIERCDTSTFWAKHELNLHIIGYVTWDSRDHIKAPEVFLEEMVEEVNWEKNMKYNGVTAHMLIGFTGQQNLWALGKANCTLQACWFLPFLWPFNENCVMHEVSHLLGADDHRDATDPNWDSDCVMSYKEEWVDFYWECGWCWYIGTNVPRAFLSYSWCDTCFNTVHSNRGDYTIIRIPNGEPGGFPPGIKDEEEV